MKVPLKVLLIVLTAAALLLGGMYAAARIFIVGNIEQSESQMVDRNIKRFFNLLNNEIDSLNSSCQD